jgi:hypothetical protein
MASSKQFLEAMDVCLDQADEEPSSSERIQLCRAASLFAQVAEVLNRGNALTDDIITHCRRVIAVLRDERTRDRVEGLLAEMVCHDPYELNC